MANYPSDYQFLTCPKCHRMHEARVLYCEGCNYHIPYEPPAEPAKEDEHLAGESPAAL